METGQSNARSLRAPAYRGAYSETLLQRQVGFFEESFAYNSDVYYRHERVAAEQQYVAKLKCLCKVGLGSVGVAATPAAEATASPGRAIERSGWPARTARSMPRVNRSGHLIGYRGRHPSHADVVVLEVNGIPGWQALQSVGDQDLTKLVVSACEAVASRV